MTAMSTMVQFPTGGRDDPAGTIAKAVRRARERHGLSGAEMARRMDMPQQSWSRRETGATVLTVDELLMAAEILGEPPGSFFPGGSGYTPDPEGGDDLPKIGARSSTDRASDYGSLVRFRTRTERDDYRRQGVPHESEAA